MTINVDTLMSEMLVKYKSTPDIVELIKRLADERKMYQEKCSEEFKNTMNLVIADFEKENKKLQIQLDCALGRHAMQVDNIFQD